MYGFSGLQNGANKTKMLLIVAVVVVVALAIALGVVFMQKKADSAPPTTDKKDNAATTERIIEKVGGLYEVPTGEEPTVAAIQDRSKLDGQEFFNKAQNGDYLLVYTKAKLALLYREETGKLINVGPINMQDTDQAKTSGPNNTTTGQ